MDFKAMITFTADRCFGRQTWLRRCALAAMTFGLFAPSAASAQAWIGEFAARIASENRAMNNASKCHAGVPQPAKERQAIEAEAERLVAAYFALNSSADSKLLATVFDTSLKDARWRKGADMRNFSSLGAELDAASPRLVRVAFETGGDAASGRGLWRSEDGSGSVYIVEIAYTAASFFASGWRIQRLAIMPDTSEAAALIYPFCELSTDVPDNLLSVLYGPDGKALAPHKR
jgi:hypothetical protein